jgi:hypothetical protein
MKEDFYCLEQGNFVFFDNWNFIKYREYEGYKGFYRGNIDKFKKQCAYMDKHENLKYSTCKNKFLASLNRFFIFSRL